MQQRDRDRSPDRFRRAELQGARGKERAWHPEIAVAAGMVMETGRGGGLADMPRQQGLAAAQKSPGFSLSRWWAWDFKCCPLVCKGLISLDELGRQLQYMWSTALLSSQCAKTVGNKK